MKRARFFGYSLSHFLNSASSAVTEYFSKSSFQTHCWNLDARTAFLIFSVFGR